MIVSKWGNSLAVRLPAKLVKELGLEEGDALEAVVTDAGALRLKKPEAKDPFAGTDHLISDLPEGYRFDREEANKRG
ncbi:MAG: AbrB/MazE/SpoVT family DNA-binding domain-containing protein [Pseudomonadota bacterium]